MSQDQKPDEIALQLVAELAGVEASDLSPETELVAHLGIDSPRALQLTVEIEDALGIEIEDEDLAELRTVGDVLRAVRRTAESSG